MYRNRLYIRCYNYTEHAVTIRLGVDPDHARRRAAWGPWRLACRYRIHDRVAAIGFGFSGTILNQASIYLVHFRVSQSVSFVAAPALTTQPSITIS